ncbi:MAG: putative chitinase [Sphingomonadales bacterium]|jgi:putative chitinase|nr:putative chitinase [Sphingomonadales bacterium]
MAQAERDALFAVLRPMLDQGKFNVPGRLDAVNGAVDAIEAAVRRECGAGDGLAAFGGGAGATTPASTEPLRPKASDAADATASPWQAMIDLSLLKVAFRTNSEAELVKWVEATRTACIRWGIDQPREIASFLANISVESRDLQSLTENLNYSTDALITMFGRHRISVEDAQRYGRNAQHPADQEELANILYGGPWGAKNLGNTEPGDGWQFKGYGPKQLTGRANQSRFAEAMGIPVDQVPAYIRTPEGGMMSAGWFWKSHGLDAKAATPGLADDRQAINGGAFGLAEVEARFELILGELLRRERASAPGPA